MEIQNLTRQKYFFLFSDLLVLFAIIAGISIFQKYADIVLLCFWFIVFAYALAFKRYNTISHLLISTTIAICWVFIAKNNYGYNHAYLSIAGMNLLPLMAWSLGLIGVSEIFNHFSFRKKIFNFLAFIPIFWILLILIEIYAFHVIEIRDIMSGNSIGLPFCNCIHAPWWMRAVYFTMGPAYYGLTIVADVYMEKLRIQNKKNGNG